MAKDYHKLHDKKQKLARELALVKTKEHEALHECYRHGKAGFESKRLRKYMNVHSRKSGRLEKKIARLDRKTNTPRLYKPRASIAGKRHVIMLVLAALLILGSVFMFTNVGEEIQSRVTGLVVGSDAIDTSIDNSLIQYPAVIGEPVRWTKQIALDAETDNTTVEIHNSAENIVVTRLDGDIEEGVDVDEIKSGHIAGASAAIISGSAVSKGVSDSAGMIKVKIKESIKDARVEYETPGPELRVEESSVSAKRIVVASDIHYKNVLAFIDIPVGARAQVYHLVDGKRELVDSKLVDADGDGKSDKVKWIVPHLSEQFYEIIIIIKAQHLDVNRTATSNIYDEVRALDDVWSKTILDGEYVRVTFEQELDSSKDVTIYPRIVSGKPRIEVYEAGSNELITEFKSLYSDQYNKVLLTSLEGKQDNFDLRVVGGAIELDHIIDPQTADFYIQRGCETPANGVSAVTLTAGVDYTAPTNNSRAFVRIVSTRLSGMGRILNGNQHEADDWTWYISDPDFAGNSVVFTRAGAVDQQRFCWEIIEYVGSDGGANEMIVRDVGTVTYGGAATTADGAVVGGIGDDSDVVVFITGQASVETSDQDEVGAGQSLSEWVAADDKPRFTRGFTGADANPLSYAVVEFIGANWVVERVTHTFNAVGATETENINDVGDLSRAFFHAQFTNDFEEGLDDMGAKIWFKDTDEINFYLNAGADDAGNTHHAAVWVVSTTDVNADTAMNVSHYLGSRATAGVSEGANNEEDEWSNVISEVSALNETSIMGEAGESTGSGTYFPRGWISLYLVNTTAVKLYQSDDGQPQNYAFQIVQWPRTEVAAGNDEPNVTAIDVIPDGAQTDDPLNCTWIIDDQDAGDTFEVDVTWWHNASGDWASETDYNAWDIPCVNNTICGSTLNVSIADVNHKKNVVWKCQVNVTDNNGGFNQSNGSEYILNTVPTMPTLVLPNNNTATTNRTPKFEWSSSDADSDSFTSHLIVDDNYDFASPIINVSVSGQTYHTDQIELLADTTYYWKVEANDSATGFSPWSTIRWLPVNSKIELNIQTAYANFSTISPLAMNDTTDEDPPAIVIGSASNVLIDLGISADNLWSAAAGVIPSEYYRYKARDFLGGAYTSATEVYTNMPAGETQFIWDLEYKNATNGVDAFKLDINITAPGEEPPGAKSSTITITAGAA